MFSTSTVVRYFFLSFSKEVPCPSHRFDILFRSIRARFARPDEQPSQNFFFFIARLISFPFFSSSFSSLSLFFFFSFSPLTELSRTVSTPPLRPFYNYFPPVLFCSPTRQDVADITWITRRSVGKQSSRVHVSKKLRSIIINRAYEYTFSLLPACVTMCEYGGHLCEINCVCVCVCTCVYVCTYVCIHVCVSYARTMIFVRVAISVFFLFFSLFLRLSTKYSP